MTAFQRDMVGVAINQRIYKLTWATILCSKTQPVKSVQSALNDLKRPPERLQSQCNYRPFIT